MARARWTWAFAAAAFAALGASAIHAKRIGVFGDDAIYLTSGIELMHGRGYRVPLLPGDPLAGKYPPLYPAVLGVGSWLLPALPDGLVYYKLLTLLLALPGFYFTMRWLQIVVGQGDEGAQGDGRQGARRVRLVLVLCALNAGLISICGEVMSEALFFSLLMASLFFGERALAQAQEDPARALTGEEPTLRQTGGERGLPAAVAARSARARDLAAALGLATLLTYTRTLGLLLVLVLIANAFRVTDWRRAAALGAASLAALAPWWWWSRVHVPGQEPMLDLLPYLTGYGYHGQALREYLALPDATLLHYVGRCLEAALKGLSAAVLPWPNRPTVEVLQTPPHASAYLIALPIAVGGVRELWRRNLTGQLLFLYLGAATVWPWFNKTRFFVAVIPLLLLCAVQGLAWLVGALPGRASGPADRVRMATLAVATLVGLSNCADHLDHGFMQGSLSEVIAADGEEAPASSMERSLSWLRKNTPDDAVLLTNFGGALYGIHTGRDVLPYDQALEGPGSALARTLQGRPALTGAATRPALDRFIQRARRLLGRRPLYHVLVCEQACEAELDAQSWDAVFRSADTAGTVAIGRL